MFIGRSTFVTSNVSVVGNWTFPVTRADYLPHSRRDVPHLSDSSRSGIIFGILASLVVVVLFGVYLVKWFKRGEWSPCCTQSPSTPADIPGQPNLANPDDPNDNNENAWPRPNSTEHANQTSNAGESLLNVGSTSQAPVLALHSVPTMLKSGHRKKSPYVQPPLYTAATRSMLHTERHEIRPTAVQPVYDQSKTHAVSANLLATRDRPSTPPAATASDINESVPLSQQPNTIMVPDEPPRLSVLRPISGFVLGPKFRSIPSAQIAEDAFGPNNDAGDAASAPSPVGKEPQIMNLNQQNRAAIPGCAGAVRGICTQSKCPGLSYNKRLNLVVCKAEKYAAQTF